MKKITSLLLVVVMCLSLVACGGSDKKAFEASKAAYDNIDIAYEITEQFGSDIYEAWRLGIYDKDEILDDGANHLATELSLSADEIRAGAVYAHLFEQPPELLNLENWWISLKLQILILIPGWSSIPKECLPMMPCLLGYR